MSRFQLVVATVDLSPPPVPPGDHTLLTLAQAATLPDLGEQFGALSLWREADAGRLQTTFRRGRHFVTRGWLADWIQTGCRDPLSRQDSITKRTGGHGFSGTPRSPAGVAASASLAARLLKLKGN